MTPRSLPAPPRQAASPQCDGAALTAVVVACAAALVTALRVRPDAWDSLYYEDGWLFMGRASQKGVAAVLEPYSGYLHLLPRLIAEAVHVLVPVAHWGRAVTAGACLVVGVVSGALWLVSGGLVRRRWLRGVIALVPALTPATGDQVLGNLNCLHTYCLVLMAVWVCTTASGRHGPAPVGPPRRAAATRTVGAFLVALVIALTEVQVLVLAPIIIWLVLEDRGRTGRAGRTHVGLVLGWAAGGLAQLGVVLSQQRDHPYAGRRTTPDDVVHGLLVNTVLTPVTSSGTQARAVVGVVGWSGLTIILVAVLAAAVWSVRTAPPGTSARTRWAPTVWAALAVVLWLAAYAGNGGVPMGAGAGRVPLPWRWGAAGAMLMTIALLVVLDRAATTPRRAVVLVSVVAVAAVVAALGFRAQMTYRVGPVPWSVAVTEARDQQCRAPGATAHVPEWPTHTVQVRCSLLR